MWEDFKSLFVVERSIQCILRRCVFLHRYILYKSIFLCRSKQYILRIFNNTEIAVAYVRLIARNTTARFCSLSSTPFHAIDHASITLVQQLWLMKIDIVSAIAAWKPKTAEGVKKEVVDSHSNQRMIEQGFFTKLVQEVSIRLRIIFQVFLWQSQKFYSNSFVVREDIAKIHISKMVVRNS